MIFKTDNIVDKWEKCGQSYVVGILFFEELYEKTG
jgi:hypothetical protein